MEELDRWKRECVELRKRVRFLEDYNKTFHGRVKAMRESQKEYFRFRTHECLQKSKAIEKEVDAEILRVDELVRIREQQKQLTLF